LKNIGLKSIFSSSIARKLLLALTTLSIALLSISCFYFAESYRVEPVTIYKNTYKLAQVNTSILYNVSVKPSMIYDYAAVVNYPMIYLSLVQKIQYLFDIAWVVYNDTYSGVASNINYTVIPAMAINTPTWSKKFPLKAHVVSEDKRVLIQGELNMSDLYNLVRAIDSEVLVSSRRYDVNITMSFEINVLYESGERKRFDLNPYMLLSVNELNNILVITVSGSSEAYTSSTQRSVENTLNLPMGLKISVADSRKITLYSTLSLGAASIAFLSITMNTYKRKNTTSKPKPRRKVLKGLVDESNLKLIQISNYRDFEDISKRFNAPVVYSESIGKYYIIIGDVAYVYIENAPREGNE